MMAETSAIARRFGDTQAAAPEDASTKVDAQDAYATGKRKNAIRARVDQAWLREDPR